MSGFAFVSSLSFADDAGSVYIPLHSIPAPEKSPDGKLMSEHTRITLLPHRLSITASNQLILGPVDLKGVEPKPRTRPNTMGKRPTTTTFSQVPACAMVSHAINSDLVSAKRTVKKSQREGQSKEDIHLTRMPLVKAGLKQLNKISITCLSYGAGHCIAVSDMGIAFTWGSGRLGQLGHGDQVTK